MQNLLSWSLILPPIAIGTFGSLYYYPPQFLTAERTSTHCYPHIYTLDEINPSARCITVGASTGKFLEVSNEPSEIEKSTGDSTVAIPGLWDGHGHVFQLGEMLGSVQVYGAKSVSEVRDLVKSHLTVNPKVGTRSNWIRGIGWDQSLLFPDSDTGKDGPKQMPTSEQLSSDPLLRDKYIMLDRVDVHCIWVSQAVMDLLPPEKKFPNATIPGGEIPSEGVFCDNAMEVVYNIYPRPGRAEKIKWLNRAMSELNKVGFVGVHDAGVIEEDLMLYTWMNSMSLLSLRINAMVQCKSQNTYCPDEVSRFKGRTADGMFSLLGVKLFADGALGSWGAALLDPYDDKPDHKGTMLLKETELDKVVKEWHENKYQVSIHAIGDRANRAAISSLSKVFPAHCLHNRDLHKRCNIQPSGPRHRIEHAQIIHPYDQMHLQSLGIIPSIQPTHATSDSAYALARLGSTRLDTSAYRQKTLFRALSLPVVLGSDFPVEPITPWGGIYAATTRKTPHKPGSPTTSTEAVDAQAPFYPSEAITRMEALKGFTLNPAYAAKMEGLAGSIQKGKWADWVVVRYPSGSGKFLDENWNGDIRDMEVLETWVAGKKVYDRKAEESIEGKKRDAETSSSLSWEPVPWTGAEIMDWVQRVFGG